MASLKALAAAVNGWLHSQRGKLFLAGVCTNIAFGLRGELSWTVVGWTILMQFLPSPKPASK